MSNATTTGTLVKRQLDEYLLEELLGQGGMARVYRGFDVGLKRSAAIKVIDAPFRANSNYIERFTREAMAIAQLRHPNIVRLYRSGEVDGVLYMAMEYIEGADLRAILAAYKERQRLIPIHETVKIIRHVSQALDYMHGQGVIHRDIKPSNIMLDKQGDAILADFGLALLGDKTQGEIFGTPHYIAPEQAISSAGAVPQSDLYAVGVIMYEMFTGRLPFEAAHPYDVALMHLTEPPPSPRQFKSDISYALEAVLLKALAKDIKDRYQTGKALLDALVLALQSPPDTSAFNTTAVEEISHAQLPPPPLRNPQNWAGHLLPPLPAAVAVSMAQHDVLQKTTIAHHYLLNNIEALFTTIANPLSEEQLRQLCLKIPDFLPIYPQLAQAKSKTKIIQRLMEYAEQIVQIEALLILAKAQNPAAYEAHKPYHRLGSSGRMEWVGKNLGKYHIVEWLGQGGMADVYKAYQPGLARYVAIKMIHGHLVDNEEFIERFEREALAVSALHHPNIVQVFDFDREEDRSYMVMEFIAGSTLATELQDRLKQNTPYSLAELVTMFNALAGAIDYAHSRGMIHRDLKPSNIMFTPNRRVVLTDFGTARIKSVPSYTATDAIIGTPAYMSPEQARAQPVNERTDIYTLGVILYELVTGRVPFEGDIPMVVVFKLIRSEVTPPTSLNPKLPHGVEQVILKAMSQNPNDRYPTAREMATALQEAVTIAKEETLVSGHKLDVSNHPDPQPTMVNVFAQRPRPIKQPKNNASRAKTVDSIAAKAAKIGALPKQGYSLIGQRLGQHLVSEKAGTGSVAQVYLGHHHETLQQDVAIKVFFGHLSDDPALVEHFYQEAKAVAALHHRNIVQVYDYGMHREFCYLIMEQITGGSLQERLLDLKRNERILSFVQVEHIFREIAAGLDYAHAQGIIHANLKPANIMFTHTGRIVITDFGLTGFMGAIGHTLTGTSWRTPAYLSPEHARGEPDTTRSDIYALGIMLYQMVTGYVPFEDKTPIATIKKHLTEPIPSPRSANPNLPQAIEQVLFSALAKDPAQRYVTAGEMVQALTKAITSG